jgi:hypothetical protein
MYRDKNTLKTFGILLLTFIGLLGITYIMFTSIYSEQSTYSETRGALVKKKIESGMDVQQAIQETIQEDDPAAYYNARQKTKSRMKVGLILGLVTAIVLLYISSIAITYVTRKRT